MENDGKAYKRNAPPTKPGPYRFRCCDCGADSICEVDWDGVHDGWRDGLLRCNPCCARKDEEDLGGQIPECRTEDDLIREYKALKAEEDLIREHEAGRSYKN
jgi:hypothetical protein